MIEDKATIIVNYSEPRYKSVNEGLNIMDILAFEQARTPEEYYRNIRISYKGKVVESEEHFRNPRYGEKIRTSNIIRRLN